LWPHNIGGFEIGVKVCLQFSLPFLKENKGEGTCDGLYHKKRYFQTPAHSAVFCPLHKIRKRRESWQKSDRARAGQSTVCPEMSTPEDCLRLGDRVMWPSDAGNEYGTVRWIGQLPGDMSGETTVGVEFVSMNLCVVYKEHGGKVTGAFCYNKQPNFDDQHIWLRRIYPCLLHCIICTCLFFC
jgi:hypothetical protein